MPELSGARSDARVLGLGMLLILLGPEVVSTGVGPEVVPLLYLTWIPFAL